MCRFNGGVLVWSANKVILQDSTPLALIDLLRPPWNAIPILDDLSGKPYEIKEKERFLWIILNID
jgi:hypothetical protein